jgi:hypothetical protein
MANITTAKQSPELQAYLAKKRAQAVKPVKPRLIFALDATASREPAWATATPLTKEIFSNAFGLQLQCVHFRGGVEGAAEFHKSPWVDSGLLLSRLMGDVSCKGGYTQIDRVLSHVIEEHKKAPVKGFVYIGDVCEHERNELAGLVEEIHQLGVPPMIFHEGEMDRDKFVWIAGEHGFVAPFNQSAVGRIREMFGQIAQLAIGKAKLDDVKRLAANQLRLTHRGS